MTDSSSPGSAEPASAAAALDALNPELLVLLACPRCAERPPLRRSDAGDALECTRCGRIYPVTDGFPDLRLTEEEIAAAGPANGAPPTPV